MKTIKAATAKKKFTKKSSKFKNKKNKPMKQSHYPKAKGQKKKTTSSNSQIDLLRGRLSFTTETFEQRIIMMLLLMAFLLLLVK